jgi:hypothetical protein
VKKSVGLKYDDGKLRWDLLPIDLIEKVVAVLTYGGLKYGDYNWQAVSNPRERYYAAVMRHIAAWRKGEVFDSEWNIEHLAHAITSLIFLMWFDRNFKPIPVNILKAAEKIKQLSTIKVSPLIIKSMHHKVVERLPSDGVKGVVALAAGRKRPADGKKSPTPRHVKK